MRECYHCKQRIADGEAHDCWTTTEAALTRDLSEDLREAWARLRETAAEFGEQRIYASHSSIMFSRRVCYFFVRPKRQYLEVCIFLDRAVRAPQIQKVVASSKTKRAHLVRIRHRDEVEAPLTNWLREAYTLQDRPASGSQARRATKKAGTSTRPPGGCSARSTNRKSVSPSARRQSVARETRGRRDPTGRR